MRDFLARLLLQGGSEYNGCQNTSMKLPQVQGMPAMPEPKGETMAFEERAPANRVAATGAA
jgi:hypothetical protein